MAVVLSNAHLAVHAAGPAARDAHGTPVPSVGPATVRGPWPGAALEQVERGGWNLRLDPRAWPVDPGDRVSDGARWWTVDTALIHQVPGAPDVDYVAVTAQLDPLDVP